MGLTEKLFGRKNSPLVKITAINITETNIEINGQPMNLPTHISSAEKLFGKPRKITYKTKPETREFLQNIRGKGMVTKRVNYAWDDIGVYCYTDNGRVISAFGIRLSMQGGNFKHSPKSAFCGTVTIEGRPWFEVMNSAEDMEFFRKKKIGVYSVVAEYSDLFELSEKRTEKSYSGIEIDFWKN